MPTVAADAGSAGVGHNGRFASGNPIDVVMVSPKAVPDFDRRRGAERNRTAVRGFAGLCLTTRPRRQVPGHGNAGTREPFLP